MTAAQKCTEDIWVDTAKIDMPRRKCMRYKITKIQASKLKNKQNGTEVARIPLKKYSTQKNKY